MNKRKLESKMVLYGDNGQKLADYLGIARATLSSKLNETNGAQFKQGEIKKIKERYELTSEEVSEIFFTPVVS